MNLETVGERLGIAEAAERFAHAWAAAEQARPAGPLPFLAPDYLAWACEAAFLPPPIAAAVAAAARRVAGDEALSALAWYCHCRLHRDACGPAEIRNWPLLRGALGDEAGLFNVLVLLSGIGDMLAIHRRRGIPPDITRDTVLDLKRGMETNDYFQIHGCWGIGVGILGWLMGHWRGLLYQLGRLQFKSGRFGASLRAFRNRATRTVLALAEEGVRFRADGQVDGAGEVSDPEGGWTSTLAVGDAEIEGYPIDPTGHAVQRRLTLRTEDWAQVLASGDPILEIHIPVGPPRMTHALCGAAIRQALAFFPTYVPDRPFAALVCTSWILDHQFEKLLGPDSNLVQFQKEVYLYPRKGGSGSILKRVFGQWSPGSPAELPRTTSMQRAFAAHLDAGGHFRGGGGFLLPDDFDWGRQVYRNQARLWRAD